MPRPIVPNLLELALTWRDQAGRIRSDYGRVAPGQSEVAASAFETCADEIDNLIKSTANPETVPTVS